LANSERVDVVILIESRVSVADLLTALNAVTGSIFHYSESPAGMKTVQVFSRFSPRFIDPIAESHRYSIRHLTLPAKPSVLLAMVHFPSKLFCSEDSQAQECTELARMIDNVEQRVGHYRTVLVGDLNMNPFEKGVVGAAGLNATMVRREALKDSRTVQKRSYRYFFNPMWRHFGDGQHAPPGTYHYDSHEHITYFWNVFDQVLVRPSLTENVPADGIRIVDRIGELSLLSSKGIPDVSAGSDHLPLVFEVNF
jgi:endonuclease/exonuclease/phosphatase family metal-dependent hydrolase